MVVVPRSGFHTKGRRTEGFLGVESWLHTPECDPYSGANPLDEPHCEPQRSTQKKKGVSPSVERSFGPSAFV